jgi:protein-disulfide isomerase
VSANVNSQYPEFTGTPAFVINGKMLKDTAGWDKLEPQLKDALR